MGGRRDPVASSVAVVLGIALAAALVAAAPRAEQRQDDAALITLSIDATGAIPYYIAPGEEGSGYRRDDTDLARWALQEWQRSVGDKERDLS